MRFRSHRSREEMPGTCSTTFVTWAPRTLAVYERARNLTEFAKHPPKPPTPARNRQRPPRLGRGLPKATRIRQCPSKSARVRTDYCHGPQRPPNPASVCQDSAEVRQSPRESSGMRLCPPWSARAEPIPAKACQSLPKPPPNRQSPPKPAKRPPRHRGGRANENTPRKRPSLEEATLKSTS
jgi:hypothetical protein